jgi:hypothetical protein
MFNCGSAISKAAGARGRADLGALIVQGAALSLLRAPHKKGDAAEGEAAASFGSGS